MPLRTTWLRQLALCAALLHGASSLPQATSNRVVVFPQVTAYSLDKAKITLPGQLAGKLDLLLLTFAPEQQKEADTWLPVAQAMQHSNFQFRYYRLPISSRENFLFRWWDNSSMRSDQPDPETWPWVVPLYVDKSRFLHSLDIPSEKQISVLLTDDQGRVLWRTTGALTPAKKSAFLAAMGSRQ